MVHFHLPYNIIPFNEVKYFFAHILCIWKLCTSCLSIYLCSYVGSYIWCNWSLVNHAFPSCDCMTREIKTIPVNMTVWGSIGPLCPLCSLAATGPYFSWPNLTHANRLEYTPVIDSSYPPCPLSYTWRVKKLVASTLNCTTFGNKNTFVPSGLPQWLSLSSDNLLPLPEGFLIPFVMSSLGCCHTYKICIIYKMKATMMWESFWIADFILVVWPLW